MFKLRGKLDLKKVIAGSIITCSFMLGTYVPGMAVKGKDPEVKTSIVKSAVKKNKLSLVERCRDELKHLFPKLHFDAVKKSPIDGVCEVWAGNNVLYFYPKRAYLIIGSIYTYNGEDLTLRSRERLTISKLSRVNLKNAALVWGKGKTRVVLFIDPDCPFSREVVNFLMSPEFEKKVKLYVFLYPLQKIHPHAYQHSLNILCSKNKSKTLIDYARGKNVPEYCTTQAEVNKAKTQLKVMQKEAKKIGLNGVPLVFIGKDHVVFGANVFQIIKDIALSEGKVNKK